MSRISIEIHEKTPLEKSMREKYLRKIAEQSTEDLELLYRLASLPKIKKMMIKNHPQVKKFIK